MKLPKPTTEQAAILKDKSRQKIVVAVPGSGKTTLLFQAAKKELKQNGSCLLVSFTKRVEAENILKVEKYFPQHKKQIKVQTFDSFCNNVLVDNWKAAGYLKQPKFESGFDNALFNSIFTSSVDKKIQNQIDASLASSIVERAIRQQTTIKRLLLKPKYCTLKPHYDSLKRIKHKYLKRRRETGAIHYSEQVITCYKLLSNPKTRYILDNLLDRYSLILVDELQDLSPTQLKIAILLSQAKQSYYVGDDAQCIYKFRGVEATNFNTLERKTADSKRLSLSLSHRCTIPVTAFASRIRDTIKDVTAIPMQSNKEGDKPRLVSFKNERDQYTYIAEQIQLLVQNQASFSDIAVIARQHDSLAKLQRILQIKNISSNTKYTEDEEQPDIETIYHVIINILKLLENGYQEDYISEVLTLRLLP
jgi:DNA helicase-2/ATP-dependent DNA helicase PcrA